MRAQNSSKNEPFIAVFIGIRTDRLIIAAVLFDSSSAALPLVYASSAALPAASRFRGGRGRRAPPRGVRLVPRAEGSLARSMQAL